MSHGPDARGWLSSPQRRQENTSGGTHAPAKPARARIRRCHGDRHSCGRGAIPVLAAALCALHPAARARLGRRHRRAADRRQAVAEMGQAGRGREQARRRRNRGDLGVHRRERRPRVPDGADLDLHGASVPAREAPLRRARPRADRACEQHCRGGRRAGLARRQLARRTARTRQGRAGQAQFGVSDRRERFRRRGLPEAVGRRHHARALSRRRAGDQRSRRRAASSSMSRRSPSCGRRCRPER